MKPATVKTIARFLVSGGINTGSTFALYLILLLWIDYWAAYAASFVAGIALSFVLNTRFVFRTNFTLRKAVLFPLVYVVAYLVGAIVLHVSISRFGIDPRIAPFVSICATLPLTYLLTRLVLTQPAAKTSSGIRPG